MWRLVGRDNEAARLQAFLDGLAGGPSALLVEGEAGIGKTALWEATVELAAGPRVLRARCAEAESGRAASHLRHAPCRWCTPARSRPSLVTCTNG